MCHDEISMMMWQHQRLPCVTHFWPFLITLWTNGKVPHGSSYSHPESGVERLPGRDDMVVTVHINDMGQWVVALWASHGMPCGSRQMPNEGQQPKNKKKIARLAGANPQYAILTHILPNMTSFHQIRKHSTKFGNIPLNSAAVYQPGATIGNGCN